MDLDLYDEFGNYIGPEQESESEAESVKMELEEEKEVTNTEIVLHEDKDYYPSANEVYGPDVIQRVEEEDTQPLHEPIIKPKKEELKFTNSEQMPTRYHTEYLTQLSKSSELIRNICLVGHLHHGKTTLVDNFIEDTHEVPGDRFTDVHFIERDRGMSIKANPISVLQPNTKGKHYLLNIMDTPGASAFSDEVTRAIRISDGALLVVCCVEGVSQATDRIIKQLVRENLPIILIVNKLDRLCLELNLPPEDAYFKLKHTILEVNNCMKKYNSSQVFKVNENVLFASTEQGWMFSLRSFAKMYCDNSGVLFDSTAFSDRLWGDIYFNPETRGFSKNPGGNRTFVEFILNPLYKIMSHTISQEKSELKTVLASMGIYLKNSLYSQNMKPLLRSVFQKFFGGSQCLVDLVTERFPSPLEGTAIKVHNTYTGPLDSDLAQKMIVCDPNGKLMINIVKLYNVDSMKNFQAFGRIISGTIKVGQEIRVLGEKFSPEDDEDMTVQTVNSLSIFQSRYVIPVQSASAGMWILIDGIDNSIVKTATITDDIDAEEDTYIFKPVQYETIPVMKVAVEPLNPTELPRLLQGLRQVSKSYSILETRVEESGEHVIIGLGELYMDCVLHDLRVLYSDIELKVSDPIVRLCETIVEVSQIKCHSTTPNGHNKITMICEPLEKGITEDIEDHKVTLGMGKKAVGDYFVNKYDWDVLAGRNIWAFGPENDGPNMIINDTLPAETDKKLLFSIKESVTQGFQWASREGPLTDEPMRNVKFRILSANIAQEPIFRGGGQIIPTIRRVSYSSFLVASPRLMEPIYAVEIQAPSDCVQSVYTVLSRRRGHVTQDLPKPGSPLYTIKALLPALDSNGFETDLRVATQGQAFCQTTFDHWQIVPGDPMDKSIQLRLLEPSPAPHLARDLMIKTRRRKGLSEDVSAAKYFDEDMHWPKGITDCKEYFNFNKDFDNCFLKSTCYIILKLFVYESKHLRESPMFNVIKAETKLKKANQTKPKTPAKEIFRFRYLRFKYHDYYRTQDFYKSIGMVVEFEGDQEAVLNSTGARGGKAAESEANKDGAGSLGRVFGMSFARENNSKESQNNRIVLIFEEDSEILATPESMKTQKEANSLVIQSSAHDYEYLVIYVKFLNRLMQRLENKDFDIILPITNFENAKMAIVHDPNGLQIRLMELPGHCLNENTTSQWFARLGYYCIPTSRADETVLFYEKLFQTRLKNENGKMNKEVQAKLEEDYAHYVANIRKNGAQITSKNALAKGIGFKLVDMEEFVVGLLDTVFYWLGNDFRTSSCCLCFTEVSNADSGVAYTSFESSSASKRKPRILSIGFEVSNLDAQVLRFRHEFKDLQWDFTRYRMAKFGMASKFGDALNQPLKLELYSPKIEIPTDKKNRNKQATPEPEIVAAEYVIDMQHLKGHCRSFSAGALVNVRGFGFKLREDAAKPTEEVADKKKPKKYEKKYQKSQESINNLNSSQIMKNSMKSKDKILIQQFVNREKCPSI